MNCLPFRNTWVWWRSCCSIFSFLCSVFRSLFVLLSLFGLSLYCLLSFCPFSVCHCIVCCPFVPFRFVIVLFVVLLSLFGVSLYCLLSFFDLRLLFTPCVSSSFCFSFLCSVLYFIVTPFSFDHCTFSPSLIYGFDYLFSIFKLNVLKYYVLNT
jgi:hypothetical protein